LFAGLLWLAAAHSNPAIAPSLERAVTGHSETRTCGTPLLPFGASMWSNVRGECANPRAAYSLLAALTDTASIAPRLVRGAFAGEEQPASILRSYSAHRGRAPPSSLSFR